MFFIVLIKTIDEENGAILSGKNALLFLYTKSSVVLYKLFFKKLIDIDLNYKTYWDTVNGKILKK